MIDPNAVEFLPLNKGWNALVDIDVYHRVKQYKWHIQRLGPRVYARRAIWADGKTHHVYLHNEILPRRENLQVDHKNANTPFCVLDERRSNLRYATAAQQHQNQRKFKINASKFKGVFFEPRRSKWFAKLNMNRKPFYLGSFNTQEEAARAYDAGALKYYGEFAQLNFPK